ncbi:MAG: 23S rRNA (uracil(1939)-C(5))-methyltransferase RlmD [bacterium]|nr:23S rRNA (uracil(1939)-C(5))-methyltransferase RlmD [bacterium]
MSIQIRLDKMIYGGRVLGRYKGKVVFVDANGLEGELVDIRIVEEKKDYLVGNILNIQEPSPQRISPICKHFRLCGGCQWQHIDYLSQMRFKEQILREQLIRIGGFKQPHIMPVIGMENPWEYRSRSRFILKTVSNGFALGFYQAGTRDVVDIDYCHLLSREMNEGYAAVRNVIAAKFDKFQAYCAVEIRSFGDGVLVFFITSPKFHPSLSGVAQGLQGISVIKGVHQLVVDKNQAPVLKTYFGPAISTYSLEGLSFQAQPTSFFQINLDQAQRLFSQSLRLLLPQKNQWIFDGHCGVGVLSLLAAREAKGVVGIDVAISSISDAEKNSRNNGIKNVSFLCHTLKQVVSRITTPRFDSVIFNPPRDGVERYILHWLTETKPARIVYISCDPTTLSRDMKILHQGGYSLTVVQPVDMFPQTYHVESIAVLEHE